LYEPLTIIVKILGVPSMDGLHAYGNDTKKETKIGRMKD
jgi:hypothetical protein